MKATGLDHRTRELIGLHHTMTANDIMRVTGRVTVAVLNTITTRITVETATSTITASMVITTTDGTTDSPYRYELPKKRLPFDLLGVENALALPDMFNGTGLFAAHTAKSGTTPKILGTNARVTLLMQRT
jgi:hypothetical protein